MTSCTCVIRGSRVPRLRLTTCCRSNSAAHAGLSAPFAGNEYTRRRTNEMVRKPHGSVQPSVRAPNLTDAKKNLMRPLLSLCWRREWETISPLSPNASDTSGVYGNVYRDPSFSVGSVNGKKHFRLPLDDDRILVMVNGEIQCGVPRCTWLRENRCSG